MIPYEIIRTGSKGNAVVLNHSILLDCGVPYTALRSSVPELKLVLLTHMHSDHFHQGTLRRLAQERPTLRFACGEWLARPLIEAGVRISQIDILQFGKIYGYGICNVIPFPLVHDVPNCGWKIHLPIGKAIYATDTGNLRGVRAWHYDLYLLEANYAEKELDMRIAEKQALGEYAYEYRARRTHLSVEKCNDFYYRNSKPGSELVYLHCHEDSDSS